MVDEDKKLVILTFNDNFYPEELVNKAIMEFNEVCDSSRQGEKLILKPKDSEIDINTLGYEFYNYLLGLIKS